MIIVNISITGINYDRYLLEIGQFIDRIEECGGTIESVSEIAPIRPTKQINADLLDVVACNGGTVNKSAVG